MKTLQGVDLVLLLAVSALVKACVVVQVQTLVNEAAHGAAGVAVGGEVEMACLASWRPDELDDKTKFSIDLKCTGEYSDYSASVSFDGSCGDYWQLNFEGGGFSVANGLVPLNATAKDSIFHQKWYAAGFDGCTVEDFPKENLNDHMDITPAPENANVTSAYKSHLAEATATSGGDVLNRGSNRLVALVFFASFF